MCQIDDLQVYECAIDAYQRTMNTNEHRDYMIGQLIKDKLNISFLGSHMIFDPLNEKKLAEFYRDENGNSTTEGRPSAEVVEELAKRIGECKRYACFTLGSIMRTDNVCHHVAFVVEKGDVLKVKMINSGLYYLARSYEDVLVGIVERIAAELKFDVEFNHPYISTAWVGLSLQQKCNPQDFCRGGLTGEIHTYLDRRMGVHRESYCQTWCILMMLHDISRKGYSIDENYFADWSTDRKTLEIMVREFAVGMVTKFEKKIGFSTEFWFLIRERNINFRSRKLFSNILLEAFRNLHPEIRKTRISF